MTYASLQTTGLSIAMRICSYYWPKLWHCREVILPLTSIVSVSVHTAEDAILEERSKEFVGEGKRWYDIRRMKNGELAKALQISVSGDLVEKHLLWPVDATVMSKDPLVKQTPGY